MATTYLTLANEALRELNEVTLTASNFSSAVGIQAFVKEATNRSLNDINFATFYLPGLSHPLRILGEKLAYENSIRSTIFTASPPSLSIAT